MGAAACRGCRGLLIPGESPGLTWRAEAPPISGVRGRGLEQGTVCARSSRDGLTLRTSFVCVLLC